MRPFAGIDLTKNKKNDAPDVDKFITATASGGQRAALEKSRESAEEIVQYVELPLPLRVIRFICGFLGATIMVSMLDVWFDEDSISPSQAYHNVPWLFWLGIGCLAIWISLKILGKIREKKVLSDEEKTYTLSQVDTAMETVYTQLGVPKDAPAVDILIMTYKRKNGEPIPKKVGMNLSAWFNIENRIFVEDGCLCLADLENRFSFPLSGLRSIQTVKKQISIPEWNKELSPLDDFYKPYKLKVDGYEYVHFKPYHILQLEHEGELWGIYFPCYELPIFQQLTGLKAE